MSDDQQPSENENSEKLSDDSPIYFDEEKKMTINRETGDFLQNTGTRYDQGVFGLFASINGKRYEFRGDYSVDQKKNVDVYLNKIVRNLVTKEPYFNHEEEKIRIQSVVNEHLAVLVEYARKKLGSGYMSREFYIDRSEYDKVN